MSAICYSKRHFDGAFTYSAGGHRVAVLFVVVGVPTAGCPNIWWAAQLGIAFEN